MAGWLCGDFDVVMLMDHHHHHYHVIFIGHVHRCPTRSAHLPQIPPTDSSPPRPSPPSRRCTQSERPSHSGRLGRPTTLQRMTVTVGRRQRAGQEESRILWIPRGPITTPVPQQWCDHPTLSDDFCPIFSPFFSLAMALVPLCVHLRVERERGRESLCVCVCV